MSSERVFLLCCLLSCTGISRGSMQRKEVLETILKKSRYDARIAPNYEEDRATNVTIQLYILSIDSINELSMDYSLELFLRQTWLDHRLNFEKYSNLTKLELDQKIIDSIWVPDTYFPNEKTALFHKVTVPNKLLHLYRNGTIFYSTRLSMTLSCPMELMNYPLDYQVCPIIIESYGYTVDNVVFGWDPVAIMRPTRDLELPQFNIMYPIMTSVCDKENSFGTGNLFACIEAKLHLKRNIGYYMAQIFIPSFLIVVLSWISFWIHVDAVPARISLGVLTILTMTTQTSGIRSSLPRVSYIKAIDVWMSACLIFVFSSLLEFAYINVQTRKHSKRTKEDETRKIQQKTTLLQETDKSDENSDIDYHARARRIDKISRVLFPASFLLYNVVFWSYYLPNYIHVTR